MDKGAAYLLCVFYVALSQVPITNAEWRGNVCKTKRVEYLQESYCNKYLFSECVVRKTKLTSKTFLYESCCPEWEHNGDQNCNIQCPDKITFVPDKPNIKELGALKITCLAKCSMSCSFQWIKQSISDTEERVIADFATLQITNATRRDAGNYSCRAINRATNKTVVDSITLEVLYNDDLGLSNSTNITEKTSPPSDNDDLGRNSSNDMTEKNPPLSDAARIQSVINALAGTALVFVCFICGFLVYETRKGCYQQNSHFTTAAEVGHADNMEFNTYSDPCIDYWTIGNDSTEGHNTTVSNTGARVYDQTLAIKQDIVYEDPW